MQSETVFFCWPYLYIIIYTYIGSGLADLPARFIRDSAVSIAYPISYIIILSLKTGVVPGEIKTARVIPLYKKDCKLEPGNYKPVSILSTISKILEKAVHIQLGNYFINFNEVSVLLFQLIHVSLI